MPVLGSDENFKIREQPSLQNDYSIKIEIIDIPNKRPDQGINGIGMYEFYLDKE